MNNNIKRAKQYIDCFNKENPNITYTCFGPTGPTGPTGPAGATITVGVTTTTDPGTNASVVNTGTPSNAVLEFKGHKELKEYKEQKDLRDLPDQQVPKEIKDQLDQLVLHKQLPTDENMKHHKHHFH